jgi:hypothetical protein
MSTKFKVGERVKVYADQCWFISKITAIEYDMIKVEASGSRYYPQQCRRLKPKVKKVPREIWLERAVHTSGAWYESSEQNPNSVLFREVL